MLINLTHLLDIINSLQKEYDYQISLGKKPSQIKVRYDCILKGLESCIGYCVPGLPSDKIFEVD